MFSKVHIHDVHEHKPDVFDVSTFTGHNMKCDLDDDEHAVITMFMLRQLHPTFSSC